MSNSTHHCYHARANIKPFWLIYIKQEHANNVIIKKSSKTILTYFYAKWKK